MRHNAIRWVAQFEPSVCPGWPHDGRRAAKALLEATLGAVAVIACIYLLVVYGVVLA